jgi:hypothetical protein
MPKEEQLFNQKFLRLIALTAVFVGAVVSLFFMFNAGRNQKSIALLILFTGWVLSPFIGFFMLDRISSNWKNTARLLLYCLITFLAIGAMVAYSGILIPTQTKNAFIFLIAPLISWILIVIFFLILTKLRRED